MAAHPARAAAAAAADDRRGRRGEELHAGAAVPGGAAAVPGTRDARPPPCRRLVPAADPARCCAACAAAAPPIPPSASQNGHEPEAVDRRRHRATRTRAGLAAPQPERPGRELGQVHGLAGARLTQLGAAGEAVGQHRDVRGRGPDGRQQHPLGARPSTPRSGPARSRSCRRGRSSRSRARRPRPRARPAPRGRPRCRARRAGGSATCTSARCRGRRRLPAQCVGVVGEHLGESPDALREAGGERLVGQQLGPVGAQGGGARRLEPDDRDARREPRLDRAQAAPEHAAGGGELAGGGPGEPAADGARRQLDGVAGASSTATASAATPGSKWLVNVSGHSSRPADGRRGRAHSGRCPAAGERATAAMRRDRPLRGDPAQPLRHRPQRAAGRGVQRVDQPRRQPADQMQPQGQGAHRVVRRRTQLRPRYRWARNSVL